jgi:3-dehydroquinate synthase
MHPDHHTLSDHQMLRVELAERSYPIFIGNHLLSRTELLLPYIRGKQVLIVTNTTVAPLYLAQVKATLSSLQVDELILPDGEQYKTLDTVALIYDKLMTARHNRKTTLIALGGGVIGDMTGFAAATYQRGVDFIQIPTTLLSQVDSSVGGKTGVNHPQGKNMIGAFYQPRCVLADTTVLQTLPERELAAGIAEVIKYGLIVDKSFYAWLLENTAALYQREQSALAHAIYQSCLNKARVVAADEREETDIRALLNLGHTFGHAIETAQGYGQWLHGEAVAAGMVLAAQLSQRLGFIAIADVAQLEQLLQQAHLPIAPPRDMTAQQFLDLMGRDKKVIDGRLRLVLLRAIGDAFVSSDTSAEQVTDLLVDLGLAPK